MTNIFEKICKVIELYNQYKGNLNDDGTVATDEQIAEWIVPSIEDYKEEINEKELDKLSNEYLKSLEGKSFSYIPIKDSFKAGYLKALEQ